MKTDPLKTISKLTKHRYKDAKAVFWAGSVSKGFGTPSSDLDLVIIVESLPNAYREAFIEDGWPIDAFIHDLDTLRYFCQKLEVEDGKPALINMILKGREILESSAFSQEAQKIAKKSFEMGPSVWSQSQIDKERFFLTDILDDIACPKNETEKMVSAIHLFEPLIQFYFRSNKKWSASGKSLIRRLESENPELALEVNRSFESLFRTGDVSGVQKVAQKILIPYGGLFWDGFRSDAPSKWKQSD